MGSRALEGTRAAELAYRPAGSAGDPGLGGAALWTAVVRSPRGRVCALRELSAQERSVELLMVLRDGLLSHSDRDASAA